MRGGALNVLVSSKEDPGDFVVEKDYQRRTSTPEGEERTRQKCLSVNSPAIISAVERHREGIKESISKKRGTSIPANLRTPHGETFA